MEIYAHERPLALLAAAAPAPAARISAADAAQLPRVHQVLVRAESVQAVPAAGSSATRGFAVMDSQGGRKRTDARGVPPRGRPV